MNRYIKLIAAIAFVILSYWLFTTNHFFFRIDMTEEGRYTISSSTKEILKRVDEPIHVDVYLGGNVDANMVRLRYGVRNMVDEFNAYMNERITISFIDPNDADSEEERYANYERLERRGLHGMSVAVRDNYGGVTQNVIFPWAEVSSKRDTVAVCLMQPGQNLSGEESVNEALSDQEYLLIDAIRILTRRSVTKVAFIEGHGELSEADTYDFSTALSRYFQVDRGVIGTDATVLDDYAAIIIAAPKDKFTETEKFVIDQYVMNGGKVFWCLDGVQISESNLAQSGVSPIMPLDLNLQDMLFKYGVRITSSVVEDMQCAYMPVNIARPGEEPKFEPIPWFYSPLLQTSPYHPITKNRSAVKGTYVSAINFPGDTNMVKKHILLMSSNASHVSASPNDLDIRRMMNVEPQDYFRQAYVPVAAVLEGNFPSVFMNRMMPKDITKYSTDGIKESSVNTKMIIVGDGDIIKNDFEQSEGRMYVVPLGYDRITQQTYGNKDFALNAMLYLTDEDNIMELRNKMVRLRLLNRAFVMSNRTVIVLFNVLMPIFVVVLCGAIYVAVRKRKWTKHQIISKK